MFYHGTTTYFNLHKGDYILPAIETGILRESWRKKLIDKVFFTNSPLSAIKFAKKAAARFGGEPVVYMVKPCSSYYNNNTNEYIADKIIIIGVTNYV